jgi:quercetin dioxygenase-like cupin family protein
MGTQPRPAVVPPGEGRFLGEGSTRPTVKVGPHLGSERIGLLESHIPPGGGFPAHVHDDYEEVFYVLAGSVDYLIDSEWVTASAGSAVFVPSGRRHGFRNSSDAPAQHLAIASPSSAMSMIEELMAAPPDDVKRVLGRYGSRLDG